MNMTIHQTGLDADRKGYENEADDEEDMEDDDGEIIYECSHVFSTALCHICYTLRDTRKG